jgi:hypothetical protein
MWAIILIARGNSRLFLDHRDRGVPATRILPPNRLRAEVACSPAARVGGVDGGERGDTLRQPAGGLTAERATTSCTSPIGGRHLPRDSYRRVRRGRAVRRFLCTAKAPEVHCVRQLPRNRYRGPRPRRADRVPEERPRVLARERREVEPVLRQNLVRIAQDDPDPRAAAASRA